MSAGRESQPGRRRARRDALFVLYQQDLLGLNAEKALERYEKAGTTVAPYTRRLVLGVEENLLHLDSLLDRHLENWTLSRLGPVERNILRLAAFELLHVEEVGEAVAINEAVELSKRFGSYEAAGLINGVLGAVVGDSQATG